MKMTPVTLPDGTSCAAEYHFGPPAPPSEEIPIVGLVQRRKASAAGPPHGKTAAMWISAPFLTNCEHYTSDDRRHE